MKKKTKKQKIPYGTYCYKIRKVVKGKDGMPILKTKECPFKSRREYGGVVVHFCEYLNQGDYGGVSDAEYDTLLKHFGDKDKLKEALPLFLLWDGCKECNVNMDDQKPKRDARRKAVENVKSEKDKAEIQLVIALVTAIKGFKKTNPEMTVIELDDMIPKILNFAREALED